jgi:hypothetical protein
MLNIYRVVKLVIPGCQVVQSKKFWKTTSYFFPTTWNVNDGSRFLHLLIYFLCLASGSSFGVHYMALKRQYTG